MGKFLIYEEWLNSVWHETQGFNKKARENGMSFDKTWRQTGFLFFNPSLLEFVRLKNRLSEILELEVDLVMRNALKPHIGEKIIDEAVSI